MKVSKRVLGRILEGIGISIIGGTVVGFSIRGFEYWYWFIFGFILIFAGALLSENT